MEDIYLYYERVGGYHLSSLFKQLYHLLSRSDRNQLEDYLTEIFAQVLNKEELLHDFLNTLTDIKVGTTNIREVTTQKTYNKQVDHLTDSRPDLLIRFSDGGQPHVLCIENKLGTGEGDQQLKRYADHLRSYETDGCQTHLVYITKLHDPKQKKDIISSGAATSFHQVRWFQIYNWLKRHRSELIDLLLEYMEEMQLNDSRRFVPQDIYAIQHMERLIRMMDGCLEGKVEETVSNLFNRSTGWTNRFAQLKEYYRYMKQNDQGNFSVINFGFYITDDEYTSVCIMFEVNPKCPKRVDMIAAMKEFVESNEGWFSEDLDDNTAWANIYCEKSLLDFLSAEDHIEAIQAYFITHLTELYSLKQQHPEFDWKSKESSVTV
ncbi:PD-(D/E)XK nuclease family protein [Paenibacillus sp. FJAT-27812]|uniref:PD-(D/E)XK nuclease family protein n=1 Tax=Paenibacillus sp. FJAT-27812 TaxID=1684143 RepID=UPI0006A7AD14|nr:PD-(D/E)XK nuclease family protein [Paenibacillus sp. FJAT-27812]